MSQQNHDASSRRTCMKEVLARLNSDLKKIDEIILAFSRGKSPLIQEISHHLIFSGGKRIRPVLLIMAAKLFGTKSQDNHHNLGIVPKILCLFRATCSVLRASWIKITEARCTKHEARNIPDTKFCLITTLSPFRGKSRMRVDFMADEISSLRIPVTYVPARNTIFLSYALAYGEVIGAFDIFIGVNAVDYSGYPDCRPEFIQTFEKLANLATAAGIEKKGQFKIHTPLIEMSKKEIIESGIKLGIDYSQTHSCYDPVIKNGEIIACKECDSCRLRLDGFNAANTSDPIKYA